MKKQDLKQLPLSQAAFPVSPSPPQESGRALRMNATCGRKCAALLPSCGPVGCLGKMLLASSIWGSTKRSLTWQKRDTLFSHSYFRLAASAHGMSASELLSSRLMFPTPLASDNNTARDAASLDVFLSDNGIFRKRNRNGTIWSLSLSAAVFYLTPVASDGFRSTLKPSAFDPAKKDGNLSAQIISQEQSVSETAALTEQGIIAVLVDPAAGCVQELHPDALVDAILAKKNLGTHITDAPIVIAVGPGFTAGVDCHAAVETMRGHTLGRVLYTGSPLPNTGVPGVIGGHAAERVLRAPADGLFEPCREIGDLVETGDTIAYVAGKPMKTTISGCLRGLLQAGVPVHEGMKSGDVDPRGKRENCDTASDKALAVGGGVLEALLHFSNIFH